ncbi:hypothetical protein [Erythrobacter sp. R86502]|uniref:hypothetical protein n=1 Tax=Erythrobacter sp. R86502 TaxID=3093846 RepID=UPI0036D32397
MKLNHPEVALQRALAAALAKLMGLLPFPVGTHFRVAAMLADEGDGTFDSLGRAAGAAGVDYLIAVSERQRSGAIRRYLSLITTVGKVTIARTVEPARFGPGQPVVLVSADHRHGWQLRAGRLVSVAMRPALEIERGIEAMAGEVDDLLELSAERAPYSAVTLPSALRSSVAR